MNAAVARLTGPGLGAIAVIAVRGPDAPALIAALARSPRAPHLAPGHVLRSDLLHQNEIIDDALILRAASDAFELHVHGGVAVVDALLAALLDAGGTRADPAAFLGPGLIGEIRAALPHARTLTAARLLAAQSDAGLTAWSRRWLAQLADRPADLWKCHAAAQWLLDRAATLDHLLQPARIALIGPPNAGKSTLANALLGRPAAITSPIPGTTRDWIDADATFSLADFEIPVTLIDTAGLRTTADPLEAQSILRARGQARAADAILLVLDAAAPLAPEIPALLDDLAARPIPLVIAANKSDLPAAAPPHAILPAPAQAAAILPISARTHDGLIPLTHALLHALDLAAIRPTEPFPFAPRHRRLLRDLAATPTSQEALPLLTQICAPI